MFARLNIFAATAVALLPMWPTWCNEPDEDSAPAKESNSDEQLEVLVVTGTYLYDQVRSSTSPIAILDQDDLNELAAFDIKDLFRNLTSNSGSLGLTASNWVGDDNSTGNASINMRNLGNGATLVLIDGKRTAHTNYDQNGSGYVDIQGIVPNIVLERVEVVRDGASSLYGADAVAGVVNFISKDPFRRGLEIRVDLSLDHETRRQQDRLLSALAGGSAGSLDFLVSASYLDRTGLTFSDRFDRFGRSGLSSFGQPGRYVPQVSVSSAQPVDSNYWWPQGGPDRSEFSGSLPDLECTRVAQDDGPMGTLGLHPEFPHICVYDYSSFFPIIRPETQAQLFLSSNWTMNSNRKAYMSFSNSRLDSSGNNSFYPDVRFVIIPEHNFGLILDAARRGFEPVSYQAMQRLLGGTIASTSSERPVSTVSTAAVERQRLVIGMRSDLAFFGEVWNLDGSVSVSQHHFQHRLPTDTYISRMDLAFDGFGGPECDITAGERGSGNLGNGNCYYFNSFQTSVYDPVTGEIWDESDTSSWAADPSLTVAEAARKYHNPTELLEWLHASKKTESDVSQWVLDAIAVGIPFDLRGRPFHLALGAQVRQDSARVDYDAESNAYNLSFLAGDRDWKKKIRSWSLFSEFRLPLRESVDLSASARFEKFLSRGESTFDPKVAVLADLTPSWTLRSSWGTSFKVGSLLQTGGSRTIFLNSSDPFSNAPALAYRSSAATGNPDLKPETATVFSIGTVWTPGYLRDFRLTLDYYRYDYRDLIVREGHQELIDIDNELRCPDGTNNNPQSGPLCGVWDHDGDGITTVFSIGDGIPEKVIRREDGFLVRTETSYLNAPNMKTQGIDVALEYALGSDRYGDFRFSLHATRFLEYDITLANGTKINGLGSRNTSNSIGRPMPKFRSDATISWKLGRHAGTVNVMHISGYQDDAPRSRFLGFYIGYADHIEPMTTINASYHFSAGSNWSYEHPFQITVGAKNLLNVEPPLVHTEGAYDYYTHDPRGRIYFARLRYLIQ